MKHVQFKQDEKHPKRILRWVTDRNCDKCKGNGFYDVDLRDTAVFMERGNYPRDDSLLEIRVVCRCVQVE